MRVYEWRRVAAQERGSRQTTIGEWGAEVPVLVHDHRHDFLWEREGDLPPCKLPPTDPYFEPSK